MIARLTGQLLSKSPSTVILDVQGVGYEISIALSTYFALPHLKESVTLAISTHIRNDTIQLFGFLTPAEKETFTLLTGISGIGPKLALSALSTLSVKDILSAIQRNDVDRLSSTPGIGKKSASRIVLELKDKVAKYISADALPGEQLPAEDTVQADAESALTNLGYRPLDVQKAIKRSQEKLDDPSNLELIIRESLKVLAKN
ncbi:MAG: Holliday junction ATP-dependent DNA helicase RuvA [Nitrospirales bacterium]|nr:MAG: Holliday junction ATP-dependent DNA helicase RuvA [Nitrospirales bacterium]